MRKIYINVVYISRETFEENGFKKVVDNGEYCG